ncbi:MAG TPA: 50S ribosomal protein L20 [Candidatus Woesebacteria bacterium]|jgi:large subunit ribosomal protein L20|nr:50S ribosomal protein L20 [Candidatus Woesebacteria bacterium]HNS65657.1 50S ribosomal protein L20 [Candidatus Woesebacteria bacterium]
MPRTKTGTTRHHRHKKVLDSNKGFRGANHRLYKRAHEALLHAGQYAYIGRKLRKRDFRKLWITRLSAAIKEVSAELNYSRVINLLKKANIQLNRKMLSEIAIRDFETFKRIITQARG